MNGLTTNRMEHFRRILSEEKARILINSQEAIKNGMQVSEDKLADETDLAASELHHHFVLKMKDRERRHLNQIEAAIFRVEQGCFGLCEECEESIEQRRLEANPFSTLCLSCKEREEHREKIYA